MPNRNTLKAFTLIELSIVIVIIGLLFGGVLVGQAIYKSQQLRSISTEANGYLIAAKQFNLKYGALPGDFDGATAIWGRADGGTPSSANCSAPTASVGDATCNGDGNGNISMTSSLAVINETFLAWAHLSSAKLVVARYSGVGDGSVPINGVVLGKNIPKGPLDNTGYMMFLGGEYTGATATIFTNSYNALFVGFGTPVPQNYGPSVIHLGNMQSPALTTKDAWLIDTKLDDGMPALGKIMGTRKYLQTPNCTTGSIGIPNDLTVTYDITYEGIACGLFFLAPMNTN